MERSVCRGGSWDEDYWAWVEAMYSQECRTTILSRSCGFRVFKTGSRGKTTLRPNKRLVVRGGSMNGRGLLFLRSAGRNWDGARDTMATNGFRVILLLRRVRT
jgi:formylglycine-generating enzyme required for sulfatase activity